MKVDRINKEFKIKKSIKKKPKIRKKNYMYFVLAYIVRFIYKSFFINIISTKNSNKIR